MLACLIFPLSVPAHPASSITLEYNDDAQMLTVDITHGVSDPQTHYIYTVVLSKNGEVYQTNNYTSQPTGSSFTYMYEVSAVDGDVLEVFTDCNLGGSLTEQLTVTGSQTPSDGSGLSIQAITYYPILGLPFIVYIGIITLVLLILTAGLQLLKMKGKIKLSLKWHKRLAYLTILFALIHGILGILVYL